MPHSERISSLTRAEFDARVRRSALPVLVHFRASWCTPCRTVTRLFGEHADDFEGRATFVEVDVDASPELVETYAVANVPTVLLFANGRVSALLSGRTSAVEIEAALHSLPPHPPPSRLSPG